MQINWIPTNQRYHAVIGATDAGVKLRLYREYFLQPWQPMMGMLGSQFGLAPDDELGVARAWAWPLPDELNSVPDALAKLEAAGAWSIGEQALHRAARHFAHYDLPFDTVEGWITLGVPERSNSIGNGYSGSVDWTAPRFLCQYSDPTDRNIRALPGAVAHEFHHLVRLRAFPWDMQQTSVADYIIHEGMAESFATALFGEQVLGYYVADIGEGDLHVAKNLIRDGLEKTGFDVIRGYIFGDTLSGSFNFQAIGMPNYGGYAVGYHVVQAFLKRTGCTIEAATFLPALQIVRESGYFD
jgi:uncharacterized protein YjaZ